MRTIAEMALQQGIDLSAQGGFGVSWLFRIISCKFSSPKSSLSKIGYPACLQRIENLNLTSSLDLYLQD